MTLEHRTRLREHFSYVGRAQLHASRLAEPHATTPSATSLGPLLARWSAIELACIVRALGKLLFDLSVSQMNAHSWPLTRDARGLSTLTVRLWSPHIEAAVEHVDKTPVAGPILDLGCGQANHMKSIPARSRPVIGIDIDFDRLRQASSDDPKGVLVLADAERLPFCDAAFSGLLSVSVLQYVDHERTLKEVGRVLHSGARTGFVENLYGSPVARVYRILHRALGIRYGSHMTPQHHLRWEQCEALFNRYIRISSLHTYDLTTPFTYLSLIARTLLRRRPSANRRQLEVLQKVDNLLLARAHFLARYCWIVCVLGEAVVQEQRP